GLRIVGPLDREVLRDSLDAISRRHELLRTTFAIVDGEAVQTVHPPFAADLNLIDAAGAPDPEAWALDLFRQQAARGIDPGTLPLVRFWLVKIRDNEHWMLRIVHHILFDAWSVDLYVQELAKTYETI